MICQRNWIKCPAVTGLSSCHSEWNSMGKNKDNHANIQNKVLKQDIMLAVWLRRSMALIYILLYSLPNHQISSHFTHFRGKILFDDFFCLMRFLVSCYQIKKTQITARKQTISKQNKTRHHKLWVQASGERQNELIKNFLCILFGVKGVIFKAY